MEGSISTKEIPPSFNPFLALQVMMGNGVELDYEEVVRMLPKDKDGALVDLTPFDERAKECATGLVEFVEANKKKKPKKNAPSRPNALLAILIYQ